MEWETLTNAAKKDLLYMMVRTSKPILFRVGPIMNMNIDSFLSVGIEYYLINLFMTSFQKYAMFQIMKSSYSAFSVLQSTGV